MPDKNVYEDSMKMLDELEESLGGEYPEVMDTLMTAKGQLEEAHGEMDEEALPPELGEEDVEGGEEEEDEMSGPLGELPPGLEEDEEEEDEELPPGL